MNVRPLHWLLYLLGLGHRLSPIGLGRVVTCGNYTGDGPSLGWVTERLLWIWASHDASYRWADRDWLSRGQADMRARRRACDAGRTLAQYRLAWLLASPMLVLAWRYEWGGWQDLPPWLWWSCLAVWSVLWCGGWAGLGWLAWRAPA